MRKTIYTVLFTIALSLADTASWAGNVAEGTNSVFYINAPRFVRPLIERWISEYKKVQPSANFALAKNESAKKNSILNVQLSENKNSDIRNNTVYFGEYAVLPVTTKNSEAAKALAKKELNQKRLKTLLFVNDEYEEPEKKDKLSDQLVVYTGNGSSSVSVPYASYFGKDASSYRGKRIIGDDAFLNTAIERDSKGITFNALSNIYDLQSRKINTNLELVPLETGKSQREAAETLDALLDVLETGKIEGGRENRIFVFR